MDGHMGDSSDNNDHELMCSTYEDWLGGQVSQSAV
jgi:hypothetical protein